MLSTMTTILLRLLAALAVPAHLIGSLIRDALWLVRARLPWALIVAMLVGVAAWASWDATRRAEAAQPVPRAVSVAELARSPSGDWVSMQAIVLGPYWDSSEYGADVLRFYYVLRDPDDAGAALLARSTDRLEERRLRTIVASVVRDAEPPLSGDGAAPGVRAADGLYLVERADEAQEVTIADAVLPADVIDGAAAPEVSLHAEFVHLGPLDCEAGGAAAVACDEEAAHAYLAFADGRGVVVASPYAPDALPVEIRGVPTVDSLRVEQALAEPAIAEAVAGLDHPDGRLLAEGSTPFLVEVSYLPATLLAVVACIVGVGWLLGYPVFARSTPAAGAAIAPVTRGAPIDVNLSGWLAGPGGRLRLDDAPGSMERLPPGDFERRRWQYGQEVGSLLERAEGAHRMAPFDAHPEGRLCLSSGHGPVFIDLDPVPIDLRLQSGELHRVASSRPALRLRTPGMDVIAAFESPSHRLRALAEIDPSWSSAIASVVAAADRRPRPKPASSNATQRQAAAAAFAFLVVGGVMTLAGLLGLVQSVLAGDVVSLVVSMVLAILGTGIVGVAIGVHDRRDWARSIGLNVGWIGAGLGLLLAWAAPQGCELWMSPRANIVACQPAGIPASLVAIAAAAALGYAGWTLYRLPGHFDR